MSTPIDELKNRLKKALSIRNMKPIELSEKTGIPKSAISQYMSGYTKPKQDRIYYISKALNINEAWLMGYDVPMEKQSSTHTDLPRKKGVRIPVLGYVAAGVPIEAIEDIIDWEEIPEDMAIRGKYFGLSIKGHSMEPRICPGDVVIVRQQPNIENGELAIVLINGDEATCKKIIKHKNGINLVSFNPSYEPMFYTKEEVINLPVTILGKVIELRGKF